ncbi:class I SAM-dependent methyltransferase [Bradyrhizobium denitrificans]|uniref:class I SAM-dependent methyltransferase n=1 Tax=Bradyrhizobium denitrificans TaxID=2734912 RepID=UPI001552BC6C|nr:class I SAM-dependent methyltransferase [Bradyrhizobium sp. LMG 8443]NPU23956.1 class I SAM-dependent methyltransferase [Bradyrhizobium sp. LMG 8443]
MSEAIDTQQAFWNRWNASTREKEVGEVSQEQRDVIISWLESLGRTDLKIIEVGCGAGWLCEHLTRFGQVTATDLSHEVIARTAARLPEVRFIPGDFMALDVGSGYDVAISLEVLAHVADQPAFLAKIADLLKPGGCLMLATQNKPVLQMNDIPAAAPGQIRRWTDRHELSQLLAGRFNVQKMFSLTPFYNRGLLRYVNAPKVRRIAQSIGLGGVHRAMRRAQEKAWLGWTIMVMANVRG